MQGVLPPLLLQSEETDFQQLTQKATLLDFLRDEKLGL